MCIPLEHLSIAPHVLTQVVGPRNKAATARGSKEVAERTPISQLFGGALQSTIRTMRGAGGGGGGGGGQGGNKPSVTQQPMFAVHLEAHHASLEEAFAALTRPEQISGRCGGGGKEGGDRVGERRGGGGRGSVEFRIDRDCVCCCARGSSPPCLVVGCIGVRGQRVVKEQRVVRQGLHTGWGRGCWVLRNHHTPFQPPSNTTPQPVLTACS